MGDLNERQYEINLCKLSNEICGMDTLLRERESVCDIAIYSVTEARLPSTSTGSERPCDLPEIE